MLNGKMFFGTLYETMIPGTSSVNVNAKMSVVPAPDPGMEASSVGFSETLAFENSGSDVIENAAKRRTYSMTWNSRAGAGAQGLDLIRSYRQKLFGPGLIYFADPMNYTQNILSPQWASPGLIEQGWKTIGGLAGSGFAFDNTGTTLYNQPRRRVMFTVAGTAVPTVDAVPTIGNRMMVVPIPPDRTLWVGFSGAVMGAAGAVLRVRPINLDGSYAATTDLTLLDEALPTRLNASFSGATYKALEIYITKTNVTTGYIRLTSGMAQLWPIGYSPTLTGNHIPGSGDNGCKFTSDAIIENYSFGDMINSARLYKGMAIELTETGPWARTGT